MLAGPVACTSAEKMNGFQRRLSRFGFDMSRSKPAATAADKFVTVTDTPGCDATRFVGRKRKASTRRFFAMFSELVSSANGCRLPTPLVTMRLPSMPPETKAALRLSARATDSGVVMAAPPVELAPPTIATFRSGSALRMVGQRVAVNTFSLRYFVCSVRSAELLTL